MEIELITSDGEEITFFNVDYVKPVMIKSKILEGVSIVSSGGKIFRVQKNYEAIKRMIEQSNIREASIIMNA